MPIFLHYEGVEGDVDAAGHEKWIMCDSLQFGVGRAISTPTGTSREREGSAPSVSEISLSKGMDKSSTKLLTEALIGTSKTAKIHMTQTHGDKLESYLEYTLTNALVSGYSMSSGGDTPSESLSLNFTKIEMRYIPFDDKHKAGSPLTVSYDVATGKKS